jgi:glycine oxidase
VIGGGVIGLGVAWEAARLGADVAVVDPEPGRSASWAAAGLLAPVTEAHYGESALLRLNLLSQQRYPAFVRDLEEETGMDVGYRSCGTLVIARDADDNAALATLFDFQRRLGLEVRRLRSQEVRDLEPALAPSVRSGLEVAGDHQVDNRALVTALIAACRGRGVQMVRASATGIVLRAGAVSAVALGSEELGTRCVVIAAGAHSAELSGIPPIPVRPVKGQLVHLRARDGSPVLQQNVRGLDVYLVPRGDGRLVVGATMEEQGFDAVATAGAIRDLLHAAFELVPAVAEMELAEIAVGHRPATPDNAPLLGPTDVEGVCLATGHFRNGVLLLPVTAQAIAGFVTEGQMPEEIEPFSPSRFQRAEADA